MLMKDFFIYKDSGMIDEYNKILHTQKHLFKANGADKEAIRFLYNQLKEERANLLQHIETKSLELILKEKALSEIEGTLL